MQAILISKNEINKINLPKVPVGNYWITSKGLENKDKKIINIEGNGKEWQVNCNKYSKLIDIKNITVKEEKINIINQNANETNKKITIEEYGTYFFSAALRQRQSR